MLKRFSALILSAVTLAACSESTLPTESSQVAPPAVPALLTELTCKADVAAQRIGCAPASPSLASSASPELIIGGQNVYVKLTSTNVVTSNDTLSGDVTVQNLTVQPWATTDGTTPTGQGVRVFFYKWPTNGVTVANATPGWYNDPYQNYFEYTGSEVGADGILASGEVSSSKKWKFKLNGASSFTFQVYIWTALPSENGLLLWTPSTVAQAGANEHINTIWGSSSSDVWIAGKRGTNGLQHWNGTSWSSYAGVHGTADMVALWGSGPSDVYAVGSTKMQHWNGSAWSDTTAAPNTLLAIWGSSATDVYACGKTGTLVHSSGGAFTSVAGNPLGTEDCAAIWGSSSSNVYLGEANLHHFNGTTWSTVSAGISNIRAIWGTSSSNVWIGGTAGKVVHWNGTAWSAPITLGSGDVGGIWGSSASDVFVVNRGGDIWHYNGSSWVNFSKPTDAYVGVWGSSKTDVWTVGADSAFGINKVYHGTR
jgi:hypothetical protein